MKTKIKISVIVPCYNVERYVEQAIQSLIDQTYENFEAIIINDGSTDETLDIIKKVCKNDKRFGIIDKLNEGYGKAVNDGITLATGDYIAILEPDDYIDKKMYGDLVNACLRHNFPDIVKSSFYKVNNAGYITEIKLSSSVDFPKNASEKVIFDKLHFPISLYTHESSIWSAIYKKDIFVKNKIKVPETAGASYQDINFKFLTYVVSKKIVLINKSYYYYRTNSVGSSSVSNKNPLAMFVNYDCLKNDLLRLGVFKGHVLNAYYAHQLHDSVFHAKRLMNNKESLYVFLDNFGKKLRKDKNFYKLINVVPEECRVVADKAIVHTNFSKALLRELKKYIVSLIKKNSYLKKTIKTQFFSLIEHFRAITEDLSNIEENGAVNYSDFISTLPVGNCTGHKVRKTMLIFAPFTTYSGFRNVVEIFVKIFKKKYDIHLVTYRSTSQMKLNDVSLHVHVFPTNPLVDVPLKTPSETYNLDDWCKNDLLTVIRHLNDEYKYDFVLVNYVFYSKIFTIFNSRVKKILSTVDNYNQLNIKKHRYGIKELGFSCSLKEEVRGWKRSDLIISLNNEETKEIKNHCKNKPVLFLPMALNNPHFGNNFIRKPNKKMIIGYFASDYNVNVENISRFLNKFLQKKLSQKLTVLIFGSVVNKIKTRYAQNKNISFFTGTNILDFYQSVDLVINPETLPLGVKMKTIEAIFYGLPLVCTKYAVESIPTQSAYHLCNSDAEIIEKIFYLFNNPNELKKLREVSYNISKEINKNHKKAAEFLSKNLDS